MRPRILFAEDHADTRDLLAALLGTQGYETATASNLEEALARARDGEFDLYLLDYIYKDGTGVDLCKRIREFDSDTPILFFSGAHPKLQRDALNCGAQGFVLKPDFDGLHREIRQALRRTS